MSIGTTGANAAAAGLTGAGSYISLHTGDPGSTGANEAAYTSGGRQSVTWPAASGGAVTWTGSIVFNVPAGTYSYWGFWSASSGGNWVDGGALAVPVTLAAAGTVTLTQLTVTPS